MLELKKIVKDYPAGNGIVHALKEIDLSFRKSEFVSILGQSGCGKTTMLNIIGGLDHYTSGDLIIEGRSTKSFSARDWDSYRNHSIGFVFQSYNLIPHQTVLQNVELALTLSGVPRSERRKRAIKALEQVGLADQLKKKPHEMSGGQMQRVAIARAIVNDPDIILADEPTGALDTETSLQVMEILKEIAKDRLVIMVTHNPELAENYSTRIIRMIDGKVTSDSAPMSETEICKEKLAYAPPSEKEKRVKKPSMRLMTAFGLSMKNLFTKKGRTLLTSFAGSIGIIGIALIFAVSQGTTAYINMVQEETLSAYPLTLEAQHIDMSSMMQAFMGNAKSSGNHDKNAVYQKTMLYDMINSLTEMESNENDLASFKKYLEKQLANKDSEVSKAVNGVQYTYGTDLLVYTKNVDGSIILSDSNELVQELMLEHFDMDLSTMFGLQEQYGIKGMGAFPMGGGAMSQMSGNAILWQEILPGDDGNPINPILEKQYDVVYGSLPNNYDEIVIVVDENNEIDDLTMYALGLTPKEDIDALAKAALDKIPAEIEHKSYTYEDICGMEFRTVLNADCYTYDELTDTYTDLRNTEAGMKYLYDNGLSLKVTGILRPKEDVASTMLSGTIGYTHMLTEYIIENAKDSDAIAAQQKDPQIDIFTGLPFTENTDNLSDSQKVSEFKDYISSLTQKQKANTYRQIMCIPSAQQLDKMMEQAMQATSREQMEEAMITGIMQQTGMSEDEIRDYADSMGEDEVQEIFTQMVEEQVKTQYATEVTEKLASLDDKQLSGALDAAMKDYTTEQMVQYYDEVLEFSESSYKDNLKKLGLVNLDEPATINIYASSFENKDIIEDMISDYNEGKDELEQIAYTDYVGLMMSSVTSIINAITYVLIAFVAVSLIVSSIMIGVITLISVQERTKEIGILRAIGASKRNVSSMFNAETVMIGFSSGVLGVAVTYLLCIPINAILYHFTGIGNLNAVLPIEAAGILVIISVILTLIAGIIPSRSAAKKDPVIALRSE